MKATPGQIKRIHALLPKSIKDNPDLKKDLVQNFTQDPQRVSTKDMEVSEANRLIGYLQGRYDDSMNRQRKKILSMCHEMGWYQAGTTKLDWQRIGNWLEKYGHAHKRNLNSYTAKELPKLVTQFENLLKSSYQKVVGSKE